MNNFEVYDYVSPLPTIALVLTGICFLAFVIILVTKVGDSKKWNAFCSLMPFLIVGFMALYGITVSSAASTEVKVTASNVEQWAEKKYNVDIDQYAGEKLIGHDLSELKKERNLDSFGKAFIVDEDENIFTIQLVKSNGEFKLVKVTDNENPVELERQ